jgi:hypothetical protein
MAARSARATARDAGDRFPARRTAGTFRKLKNQRQVEAEWFLGVP